MTTDTALAPTESVTVSSTSAMNAGCGLDSMNVRYPCSHALRTAWSNCTVCRMLRYQYSASNPAVSKRHPVTVEKKAVREERGSIPAKTSASSARSASTPTECEA